jgi:hypothetical protein
MEESRGERLLLTAILLRAVRDVVAFSCSPDRVKRALAEEAMEWLFEEEDGSERHLTSFASICMLTDLDTEQVRRRVRALIIAERSGDPGAAAAASVSRGRCCSVPGGAQVRG